MIALLNVDKVETAVLVVVAVVAVVAVEAVALSLVFATGFWTGWALSLHPMTKTEAAQRESKPVEIFICAQPISLAAVRVQSRSRRLSPTEAQQPHAAFYVSLALHFHHGLLNPT